MMNQDQYHASLLNKGQPVGLGWDGITKSTKDKIFPQDPPNNTDVEESIRRVKDDDSKLIELNLNNIKVGIGPQFPQNDLTESPFRIFPTRNSNNCATHCLKTSIWRFSP